MSLWSYSGRYRALDVVLCAVAVLLCAVILAGCSTENVEWSPLAETQPPQALTDSVTMAVVIDKDTQKHPLLTRSRDLQSLYGLVYEGLFSLDDSMSLQGVLAESYERSVSDEGGSGRAVYIVKLRSGVVFHNGKTLDSADVAATFARIKSDGDASPYLSAAKAIESIAAIDDKTLEITPVHDGVSFLYACTFPVIPAGGGAGTTGGGELPPGTGPYVLSFSGDGIKAELTASGNWWKKAPVIRTITALTYPSVEGAFSAFDQRDVSLVASRSSAIARYRNAPGIENIAYQTREWECIIPNLSHPVLKQKAVREAIALAIDRKAVVAGVYLNQAVVADVPISTISSLYEQKASLPRYDLNRAKDVLSEAGWGYPDESGRLYSLPSGMTAPQNIPFDKPPDTPTPTTPPPTPVPASPKVTRSAQRKPLTDRDGNIIYNNDGEPIYIIDLEAEADGYAGDEAESEGATNGDGETSAQSDVVKVTPPAQTPGPTPSPQEQYGLTPLSFELLTNDDSNHPVHVEAANMISTQLASAGMDVTVVAVPFEEFKTRLAANDFDMALTSFYLDPVPDFTPYVGSGSNYSGYSSAEMDDALSAVLAAADIAELVSALSDVQQRFTSDLPMISLYFHTGTLVTRLALKPANLWEPDIFRGLLSFGKE